MKTEKDPTLNGLHIGPQLAIYSRARRMWWPTGDVCDSGRVYPSGDKIMVPSGEYVPAPCVRQDVAVVVHIFDGDANPLLLNLAEGWGAAVAAYEQVMRKARAKRSVGAEGAWFAPLPARKASRLTTFVETAAAARYGDPNRPGPGREAMTGQVGEQVTVGGIDFTRKVAAGEAEVAVRDPATGIVTWKAEEVPAAVPAEADAATEVVRGQLIAAIWQARTVDALAILWKMAGDRGVTWAGPIAMAGDARRRQIECPQRELHGGSGKCACGWMTGQIA